MRQIFIKCTEVATPEQGIEFATAISPTGVEVVVVVDNPVAESVADIFVEFEVLKRKVSHTKYRYSELEACQKALMTENLKLEWQLEAAHETTWSTLKRLFF